MGGGGDTHAPLFPATAQERFWAKVDKSGECWTWTGAQNTDRRGNSSYGRFLLNGKMQRAHRIAWELENGAIPQGQWVLHQCDNPPCCNPDHLFLGDRAENMRDAFRKGRLNVPRNTKLTESDIPTIRRRLREGETRKAIARSFGVDRYTIGDIARGRAWLHVEGVDYHKG